MSSLIIGGVKTYQAYEFQAARSSPSSSCHFKLEKVKFFFCWALKKVLFCGQFNLSRLHQHSSASNHRCTSLEPTKIVQDYYEHLMKKFFVNLKHWKKFICRVVLTAMQDYCMINNQYPFVKISNIQCLFKTRYYINTMFFD